MRFRRRQLLVSCMLLVLLGPIATARSKGKKSALRQPQPRTSDDPERLMLEADEAFARQDFAAAQSNLERALALAPTDAMGHFKLGALLSKADKVGKLPCPV